MDLAGEWGFALDPEDRGERERFWERALPGRITLPGNLQAQGHGDEVGVDTPWTGQIVDRSWFDAPEYAEHRRPGQVRVPFWLQPERHYVGAAWYQRTLWLPQAWTGDRVLLRLERPHWQTRVWLDDTDLGVRDSLGTPHVYALGSGLAPGAHRLTIRVDNRLHVDVGRNAHSVSDHTQSNWNGIAGVIELGRTGQVWIEDLQVHPDVPRRAVAAVVRCGNASGRAFRGRLRLEAQAAGLPPALAEVEVQLPPGSASASLELSLGPRAPLWDEFQPALHHLRAVLCAHSGGVAAEGETMFGLREVHVDGTHLAVNGRRTFLRGTLECAAFPRSAHPPTDLAEWRRILATVRAHGLNHVRFHSWCPPEAAFTAADEAGVYLQVECGLWTRVGDGEPVDAWLYAETEAILRAYGNHPSLLLLAHGNEPAGERQREFLAAWVTHWRARDPRRLYTGGAGWPALPENDFHVLPHPRLQAWGAGLDSPLNAQPPETCGDHAEKVRGAGAPVVAHEVGQWCVFPDLGSGAKYTGPLRAKNLEVFRAGLAAHGMAQQAPAFHLASGRLQAACYKEEVERALRTAALAGFQLLSLQDFPGQGTAPVGVLDVFWDPKPYLAAPDFARFCGPTVVLARLPRRVWQDGETLCATLEVAHFGPADLCAGAGWRLEDARGTTLASGELPPVAIPQGGNTVLGALRLPLAGLPTPARYRLAVDLDGTACANDWSLWVYPPSRQEPAPAGTLIRPRLDEAAITHLRAGGTVLLLAGPATVRTDVALGFSPVFWNTAWTRGQAPHTLGLLCDPTHPVFAAFPTENHSDWQWWEPLSAAAAMVMDDLPGDVQPLLQPIDTWFRNHRLGLLFEARCAGGRLLVCSIDLETDLPSRPVCRQLRQSILRYLSQPPAGQLPAVDPAQVAALFAQP